LPKSDPEKVWRLYPAFIENAHDVGIKTVWPGIEPVAESTCLDFNLLRSAAEQPYQEVFGRELYPTLAAKAAYLFVHIAGGHIFSNGNKRTAVLCVDTFLMANSVYLTLSNEEVYKLACDVASSGERHVKFEDTRNGVTKIIEQTTLPIRKIRKIDERAYRDSHHWKNWIRSTATNQPNAPLRQREHSLIV
jgi:death on curing protein